MIDDLPVTVWVARGKTHKCVAVHTKRDCKQLDNPQTGDITAIAPETVIGNGDDWELRARRKWCGTCAYGYRYGTGIPARDVLIEADPEDIPP